MRIVVTGATGNVGTSLLSALAREPRVSEIVGVARRRPEWVNEKTTWVEADVARSDLDPIFAGADVVVHLAWVIQPSRDLESLREINVDGSRRAFEAAARSGAGALVYASSIGAYSPGPKDDLVREDWPTGGIRTSFYSRHKSATEKMLDELEREHPELRVVRMRTALIFKREAATGIRRNFVGPFLPSPLLRPGLIPVIPSHPRLRAQAVHSYDVGEAYRLAVLSETARGAYNIAADPVLDAPEAARLLGARTVPVPAEALRAATTAAFRLRLHPTPVGWVDLALGVPLMDSSRARVELGWKPRHTADEALLELLAGLRDGAGFPTPPLDPRTTGPFRVRELLKGVGART